MSMLPPPRSAASSSSLKRKRTTSIASSEPSSESDRSGSHSKFSAGTRHTAKWMNGDDLCWHCGASPVDICHVIPQHDSNVPEMCAAGLLHIDTLSSLANAISLCPLCHRNFDDLTNAAFFFAPVALSYFLKHEEDDAARRRALYAATQTPVQRISPTADDYRTYCVETRLVADEACGGLYQGYILKDYLPRRPFLAAEAAEAQAPGASNRLGAYFLARPWHGDPMAALQHAFRALPRATTPALSVEVNSQLQILQFMYQMNDATYTTFAVPQLSLGPWRSPPGDDPSGAAPHGEGSLRDTTGGAEEEGHRGDQGTLLGGPDTARERPQAKEEEGSEGQKKSDPRSIYLTNDPNVQIPTPHPSSPEVALPNLPSPAADELSRPTPDVTPDAKTRPPKRELDFVSRSSEDIERANQGGPWKWGPGATAQHVINFRMKIEKIYEGGRRNKRIREKEQEPEREPYPLQDV